MKTFINFLVNWNSMCINPTGNTIILSRLGDYFIKELKENSRFFDFLTEETDMYYIIHYAGNTINIEK